MMMTFMNQKSEGKLHIIWLHEPLNEGLFAWNNKSNDGI